MLRAAKIALSLVLVIGAATMVSACGEDRSNLLPGKDVKEISANLDTVQQLVDGGQCFEALNAANAVQSQVDALPKSVDPELKRSLIDGVVTLTILVGKQCEDDPSLGTTGTTDVIEPDTEVTPTGATGVTSSDEETGTTGKKNNQTNNEPTKPTKPKPTPTPTPTPDPGPTTPNPPETDPTGPGPGSGGISPNQ